jgi:nitrogen fixation protein FixH
MARSHTDAAPNGRPLTGRAVLITFLAFFGVVFAVNGVMIKLAIDTMPGLEVESAYRASMGYNAEIAAARRQTALGWQVVERVDRGADGHAAVRVEARDAAGAPLSGLALTARLERPTDKRADLPLVLAEHEAGVYGGETSGVLPGQWDLVISADRGAGRVFLSRNRVVLK